MITKKYTYIFQKLLNKCTNLYFQINTLNIIRHQIESTLSSEKIHLTRLTDYVLVPLAGDQVNANTDGTNKYSKYNNTPSNRIYFTE